MSDIVLIAHNLRSCHNVGSLLRTAEGLGVSKVYLVGYTPYPLGTGNDHRLPHEAVKIDKQIHKTALDAEKMHAPGSKRSAAASVTATKDRTVVAAAQKPQPQTEADITAQPKKIERIYIRLVDSHNQELLMSLKQTIDAARGDTDVILVLGPADSKQIIKLPTGMAKTEQNIQMLRSIIGEQNVKVQ